MRRYWLDSSGWTHESEGGPYEDDNKHKRITEGWRLRKKDWVPWS